MPEGQIARGEDAKLAVHASMASRGYCHGPEGDRDAIGDLGLDRRSWTMDDRTSSTGWSRCTRGGRTTEPRLRDFVAELQDRVAPASVLIMTGALLRMLAVLAPERDRSMLARVYSHFRRTARPSRDKRAHMVAATDLLALGISLMETWAAGPPQRINKASRYRDGLIIALLISCPIRIRNLASIGVGRHLVWNGANYQLHFTAAETKTRRSYAASVPPDLTPYIDSWLQVPRTTLQSIALAKAPSARATTSGSTAGASP